LESFSAALATIAEAPFDMIVSIDGRLDKHEPLSMMASPARSPTTQKGRDFMRMATASTLRLMIVVGSAAFMLGGVGCQQTGPSTSTGSGGSGGASSGGSGGNLSGGSGGSQTGGTGGSPSGGSGGNASVGGSGEGGSGGNGGVAGGGGSHNGGAGGSAGSGEGGGGGDQNGGAGGSAGSSSGGNAGSQTGGAGGSAGSSSGGSAGSATGGTAGGAGGGGGSETGGAGGSGGSGPSTGCSNPVTPNNGSNGGVTDFTDYSTSSGKWGSTSGLYGSIYPYGGTKGSTMKSSVDTTAKDLHATGTVTAGDYAGFGITFNVCATVAAFTQVQFTIAGSVGNCNLELQIKTFDQTPTTGDPPGSCDSSTTSCYGYPAFKQIVVPTSTAKDVAKPLSDFSGWSSANAKQVVGLQWQVTSNVSSDTDAGAGCPVDVTVTKIKFLP
jgi:hypothetical protein